jgi:uncharacterized protein
MRRIHTLWTTGLCLGLIPTPLHAIPAPLTPVESMAKMNITAGMEVSLFASEPDVVKVIAGAFDARGRFWAVEALDYPNDRFTPFTGNDRIKICEDTDGDGKADKFTIFVDKLNFASSVTFGAGGIIVGVPPYILLFKDANGDDKADDPKGTILYQGFGTWDTHIGMSNLNYGPDNWLWGTSGWAAGTVKTLDMYQCVFRCKLDGSAMERIANSTNNLWGMGFNEFGQPFHSTANNTHSLATVIPNRYFAKIGQEPKPSVDATIGDVNIGKHTSNKIYPATTDVTQIDFKGGYTSTTSHAIYTARLFPKAYWNSAAFVNEATGHLMHRCWQKPKGTAFEGLAVADAENNFMASSDPWTAPVATMIGPDGAVWMVDWYNYVIQHNGWGQPGMVIGAGDAYVTPDRDHTHSRIYRFFPKGTKFGAMPNLTKATPSQLVEALKNDNMFWRTTAQRLLVEANSPSVLADLARLVENNTTDSLGLNVGAQHALWTMQGLGAFTNDSSPWVKWAWQALGHPARGVRMAALDVIPRTSGSLTAIKNFNQLNDPDPQIRLKTLLTLSDMDKGLMPAIGKMEMYDKYPAFDAVTDTAFFIATSRVEIIKLGTIPLKVRSLRSVVAKSLDRTLYVERSGRVVAGTGLNFSEGKLSFFSYQGEKIGSLLAGSNRIPANLITHPCLYVFETKFQSQSGWLIPLH